MENLGIKIVNENGHDMVLRTGEATKPIPQRKARTITGTIETVLIHLQSVPSNIMAVNELGSMEFEHSYVEIDRSKLSIKYFESVGLPWECEYSGHLLMDPIIEKFGINTSKSFTTFELAELIKMHRTFFETKDKAMILVSELRHFKSKIDKDVESKNDGRGNTKLLLAQTVESNIPEAFKLMIPVFKNQEPIQIEVEISINASDFSCSLVSPELNDFIEETKNALIDSQKASIVQLHPNLRIFEL